MYSLIRKNEVYYTIELLQNAPPAVLKVLGGYEVGLTKPSKEAQKWLDQHKQAWSVGAQSNAIAALAAIKAGDKWGTAHIEESVWPKGSQVTYSAKEIVVVKSNGEQAKVANNPIPLPPGSPSRPGLQYVAVAIASIIDIEKGSVVEIKSPAEWLVRFPDKNYPVNPAGIVKVKEEFLTHYNPLWKQHHLANNTTLKGAAFVKWLMPFLVSLNLKDYWMLASVITTDFYRVVRPIRVAGNVFTWTAVHYNAGGERKTFIKDESLNIPSPTYRSNMGWDDKQPRPIVVDGPIIPLQFSPSPKGATFKTAVKVMTDSMGFRGGVARGLGFLCSGLGYAGLPSENTRRLAMELSLIIPLLRAGESVSLKVKVSDVVPIYSAIVRWSQPMVINTNALFFVVPMEDLAKVHKDCKKHCVTGPQLNTTFVWVSTHQIPAVKSGDETGIVYEKAATEVIDALPKKDFLIVTPVYSDVFFSRGKVFNVGNTWDFKCVFTDRATVCRAGWEKDQIVLEKLVQYASSKDLWPHVVRDNAKMIGFLMSPVTSYHPMMNLLQRTPEAGALQMNSDGVWEYSATGINESGDEYVHSDGDDELSDDIGPVPVEEWDDESYEKIKPLKANEAKSPNNQSPRVVNHQDHSKNAKPSVPKLKAVAKEIHDEDTPDDEEENIVKPPKKKVIKIKSKAKIVEPEEESAGTGEDDASPIAERSDDEDDGGAYNPDEE